MALFKELKIIQEWKFLQRNKVSKIIAGAKVDAHDHPFVPPHIIAPPPPENSNAKYSKLIPTTNCSLFVSAKAFKTLNSR